MLLVAAAWCGVNSVFAQTWTQANVANTNWFGIVSSADGSILFASGGTTNGQQIYTSTNSGITWNQTALPMTNSTFGLRASADGTKVFASRNLPGSSPRGSTNSSPFFLSTNSGATWNSIFGPTTNYTSSIAMSADGNTLAAGQWSFSVFNRCWVYISTNSGASWSTNQIGSFNPRVFATADGKTLSAMIPPVLLTTTNAGLTWTTNNLPGSPYSWNSIAGSASGTILAAVGYKSNSGTYVCVSTNAGVSWISRTVNAFGYYASGWIAISSNGSRLIAPTSGAIFISTDLGASWSQSITLSTNWSVVASSADGNKLAATVLGNTTFTKATGAIWTSQTTPSPQLNLTPFPTNLTLAWTVPSTNFVLQQSSDLISWVDMTNPPVLNLTNLQNEVMLSPSNRSGFYRLKTP